MGEKTGTILIVVNGTVGILYPRLASEKARANPGSKIEIVVVGGDASVGRQRSKKGHDSGV